jgi:hypothetical protein
MQRTWITVFLLGAAGTIALALKGQDEEDLAFTLFLSGADQGVIEPCGCSGGQLGGIGRRAMLLETLAYGDIPRLVLGTGGIIKSNEPLQVIRYETILLCMDEMGYDAVGLGPQELSLGLDRLREARELVEYPFLLSNVAFTDEDDLPFLPYLIKEVNGTRVRILSFLPDSLKDKLPENSVFIPPSEAVEDLIEQAPEADLTLALLLGTREEAKALDLLLEGTRLILYSYPHSEPRIFDFGQRTGPIRYLSPGDRGRFLVSCELRRTAEGTLQPHNPVEEPLALDLPESENIKVYLNWYKEWVIMKKILQQMVEVHPAPKGAPYIGGDTCLLCHERAHHTWVESKHAHAWDTLVKAGREFDPECISCHTVGFGYKTGFRSERATPELLNVGCESCHGPCAEHVVQAGRVKTPLTIECETCHNLEHSTSFDLKEYWEKITCRSDEEPFYVREGQ